MRRRHSIGSGSSVASSPRCRSLFAWLPIFAAFAAISCGDDTNNDTPGGEMPTSYLFVSNTSVDFMSATYASIDPATSTAQPDLGALHADSEGRWSNGHLFAINRFGADNIQRIDPATLATVWQYSTGAGSNPQDISVVSATKAYVTRYELNELLIVNPSATSDADFQLGTIDLSHLADSDGIVEMASLVHVDGLVGDRIYVALQRIDRDNYYLPSNDSYLVAIDTTTDEIADLTPSDHSSAHLILPSANPTSMRVVDNELWIGCAGNFGETDGAILRFDATTGEFGDPVVTEETLGGDLSAFTGTSPAYVLWTDASFEGHVSVVDTTNGEVLNVAISGVPFVQDLEADDDYLYLPDRTPTAAGVRIYQRSDNAEITSAPISTGLPPWSIELVDR